MFIIVLWLLSLWACVFVINYKRRCTIPERIEQTGRGFLSAADSVANGDIENPVQIEVIDQNGQRIEVRQRNQERVQRFNYTLQCVFAAKAKFGLLADTPDNRGMVTRWLLRHMQENRDMRDSHRVSIRERVLATYFVATQEELDGIMLNRSKAYRDRRWLAKNAARKGVLPSLSDISSVLSGSRPFDSMRSSFSYGSEAGSSQMY